MDPQLIGPLLLGAALVFAIYRRVRRSFGRQSIRETRLYFRVAVLSIVGALTGAASLRNVDLMSALAAGVAIGTLLGYVGLRHTTFETTPAGRFYTPHTYIGLFVTALFLGRLIYRLAGIRLAAQVAAQPSGNPLAEYQRSPLTLAIFGLLIGYYVFFNLGVLRRSRIPDATPAGPHGP